MKIEHRTPRTLKHWEIKGLKALSLPDGLMHPELRARKLNAQHSDVYLAREPLTGRIVGWAHVWESAGRHDFHVYVHPDERRKGYGSALHAAARQEHPGPMRFNRHHSTASEFYLAVGELFRQKP